MRALESSWEVPALRWSKISESECIEEGKKASFTLSASFLPQVAQLGAERGHVSLWFLPQEASESKVSIQLPQSYSILPRRPTSTPRHPEYWGDQQEWIVRGQLAAAGKRGKGSQQQPCGSQQPAIDPDNWLMDSTKRPTHELHRMTLLQTHPISQHVPPAPCMLPVANILCATKIGACKLLQRYMDLSSRCRS